MSPLAQGRPWGESLPSAGVRWFLLPAARISKSYRSFPPPLPIIIIILAFPKHSWHNLKQPSPALTQPERTRHLQYGTPGILTLIKVNL